jgi:serine/threonine protein kinase
MAVPQPEYSPEELHELLSGLMPEIPGYRVLRLLGRGGMSYVYLGVQESLDRQVAIKVIQPEALRDEVSKLRFEREAQIIAKLQHPCIVGIYEIGRTEHGLLYYVLPYLARGHLGQRDLRDDQHTIIEVLRALLWALDYAHGRGVVHRDVKAENVLFDNADRPLLTDFGIALSRRDRSRVTGRGLAVGSGGHMAPEQARGESVDGRADLYSLGVLTFEMLTGDLPYRNPDPLGLALMHAVDPVPVLPADLAHWQPLIDRAMAKLPGDRFADARAMMLALDAVEASIHRLGLPQSAASRARQSWHALSNWARSARQQAGASTPTAAQHEALPTASESGRRLRTLMEPVRDRGLQLLRPLTHGLESLRGRRAVPIAAVAAAALLLCWVGLALWMRPAAPPTVARSATATPAAEAQPSMERAAPAPITRNTEEPPRGEYGAPPDTSAEPLDLAPTPDPLADLPADARLLAFAEEQIRRRRLSQPPGDNAYESLLAAEALSADPTQLQTLGAAWLEAATPYIASAIDENRDDAALVLLERGRELSARLHLQDSTAIDTLRAEISTPLNAAFVGLIKAADVNGLRALKARIRQLLLPSEWFEPHWSQPLVIAKPGDALGGQDAWRLLRLPTAKRPGLAMQSAPITRGDYAEFARQSGRPPAQCRIRTAVMTLRKRSWQDPEFAQQADHPVVCVSHADASAFADWQAQRTGQRLELPSAADWQRYAAHPGGRCNPGAACTLEGTRAAGAGAASALGIRSSQGNVREWLAGAGSAAGESWRDLAEPRNPRRNAAIDAQRGYDDIGFRLVREVALQELEVHID